MATRRRSAIVPPPPPDALETGGNGFEDADEIDARVIDGEMFPALSLYQQTGDLHILSDPSFNDWNWVVYRIKSPDEMARERSKHQRIFVTKLVGPLDIMELQRVCGGGVFEIRGFFGNILRTYSRQEFAGPLKVYAPAEVIRNESVSTNGAAAAVPAPIADSLVLRRMIRRQARQLEQLSTLVQTRILTPAPVAAPAVVDPTAQLTAVLEIADRIHQRTNPAPEAGVLGEVVAAFKQGMELRGEIEGAPERTTTELMLDKGLPMIERLLGGFLANRTAPRRAAPVHPPSSATVVNETPTTTPAAPASPAPEPTPAADGEHRWTTAVEALARAIAEQQDPRDFALTLEAILQPQEIGLLRIAGPDQVTANLRQRAGGQWPVLNTDAGALYVAAVVAELNREDEDGEGDGE